jgi:spore coat polysaccharide biosynthesis predicted glycosyltransferase SpsG
MNKLIFVTRATPESGKGHFFRVLRMAEVLRNHRHCTIVVDQDSIDQNISKYAHFEAIDLNQPESLIERLKLSSDDIIWFDIPDAQYSLIERFKGANIPLVSMNMFENRDRKRFEDIAIYPVFDVNSKVRSGERLDTVQFSGAGFISVPDVFFNDTSDSDDTVLVSMGGTDPMDFTPTVLEAIAALENTSFLFKVILPAGMKKIDFLDPFGSVPHLEMIDFGQLDFAHELKAARYALINGGMTRYECIAAKTFFIALSIHEQQVGLSEKVTRFGYGYDFGVFDENHLHQLTKYLNILPTRSLLSNNVVRDAVPILQKNSIIWIYEQVTLELKL